ncbi:MAG: hypothetical protein Udaeo2_16000 [Candidatus Udaeobacter sp.]|nr:MAG: hypothetical protein Udaeo2_16000 [Candidatus Udaeobacter sp.]
MLERARGLAQGKVRGDERDRNFSAGKTHGEIFDATALGKKFRLSWKPEAHLVHPGFVNRAGYDCVELAAPGQGDRFFQGSCGSARSFCSRISWPRTGIFTDDFAFSGARNTIGVQSEIDNLRADPGAIAQRNADAWFITRAHARDRKSNLT